MPQSGHAGFLEMNPTFGQHASQNSFWHRGHCHPVGFRKDPTSLPHFAQNPFGTRLHPLLQFCFGDMKFMHTSRSKNNNL